jgi:hypothetical protein
MGSDEEDKELEAMRIVYAALKDLEADGQNRVVDYVTRRLSLTGNGGNLQRSAIAPRAHEMAEPSNAAPESVSEQPSTEQEDIDGISPIALKWMRRSGLTSAQLSSLFSLGIDEIDLVAKSVPGKSNAERMRNVLLLLGIAGYLSSGAARVSDEKLREACVHYKAYDVTNFSKHIKAVTSDASGSRENGYTLTSRGISEATSLIKSIVPKD